MELYTKDTRLWVKDPTKVWKAATVVSRTAGEEEGTIVLKVETDASDGAETLEITLKPDESLPFLRNPDVLVGANDLTDLSYLHEPAVLHNLKVRFCDYNNIYTYCGIVLVAINPYQPMPIYGTDLMHAYSGKTVGELDPHIFAVAEDAFRCMARQGRNQSIIVSGESGAGKTVSAKHTMKYFAEVGGAEGENAIEEKVLASNPVMEAIGNAKTTRNDNSSRFGKYLEIMFDKHHHIIGARMRTYLLEKSRVVFQAETERNYHIFYQLCACADDPDFADFEIADPDEFFYTQQGGDPVIQGVDDAKDFQGTKQALCKLGVSDAHQKQLFQVYAGLLHMGNIDVKQRTRRNEDATIPYDDSHLPVAARLLGVDPNMLSKWITHRRIQTGREAINKPQTCDNAKRSRNALAKHIYAHVFSWIVDRINDSLSCGNKAKNASLIGVLDIYGFETFKVNSFEQFCINYANEKLQQQFNLHVFKLEQEEYVKEAIEWSFIDFYDNQPCIDLIEDRLGILSLLDEECKMPKGSDDNWALKMYDKLTTYPHFEKPRLSNNSFIVRHYADKVTYDVAGFMEKNKDTIYEEHLIMLRSSTVELVSEIFGSATASDQKDTKKQTVGTQFQHSLASLMENLNSTEPHYVRCIKPNDAKEAFSFDSPRVIEQLRACGVLETIRISAAGYPSRWTYDEFLARYRLLSKKLLKDHSIEAREGCKMILPSVIEDPDKYQFGNTKIFFRAGQVAYLEKLRSNKMASSMILIQKTVRRWLLQHRFRKIRRAALAIQCFARGWAARRLAHTLRQTRAAIVLQKHFRRWQAQRQYAATRSAVVTLQRLARGFLARRELHGKRVEKVTLFLQSQARMVLTRRRYLRIRKAIIFLQGCRRRVLARRQLRQLRIEARSVEGMKAKTVGLEKKIIELQQTMDRKVQEAKQAKEAELSAIKAEMDQLKLQGASESSAALQEATTLRVDNEKLKAEVERLSANLDQASSEGSAIVAEKDTAIEQLRAKLDETEAQLKEAHETIGQLKSRSAAAEDTQQRLVQLEAELDAERNHHQKKLKITAEMEQRIKSLEAELQEARLQALDSGSGSRTSMSDSSPPRAVVEETSDRGESEPQNTESATQREDADISDSEPDYIEVTPDVVPETKAHLEEARAELADARQLLAEQDNTIEELQRVEDELREQIAALQQENKQLLVGAVAPAVKTTNQVDGTQSTPSAASEEPTAGVDSDEQVRGQETDTQQELMDVKTNLARLQLANTKLMDKNTKLSKEIVALESKLRRAKGDANLEALRNEKLELEQRIEELNQELAGMVTVEQYEQTHAELEKTQSNLAQLKQEYEHFMKEQNMLDLAMAKTDLQEKNIVLQEQVEEMMSQLSGMRDELAHTAAELDRLTAERKTHMDRIMHLEQLAAKKMTGSSSAIESQLQEEIKALIDENLSMREQLEALEEELEHARSEASGGSSSRASPMRSVGRAGRRRNRAASGGSASGVESSTQASHQGIFAFAEKDIQRVVNTFVLNLKPDDVADSLPGLPAHVLFMCILYADKQANPAMIQGLLTKAMTAIKTVILHNSMNLNVLAFWLANSYRLLTNMKQFSGETQFYSPHTPEHLLLKNFDLTDYRMVLSDVLVQIYHTVVKHVEVKLSRMIVPGLLEHEAISGLGGAMPSRRKRSSSSQGDAAEATVDSIVELLSYVLSTLQQQTVDPKLIEQIFKQLFFIINANMVNNILLRKDLCRFTKGMQIRYNVTKLQEWARDHRLDGVEDVLTEVVQITQLLQCNKTGNDAVDQIFETCTRLNVAQIKKILSVYQPEEFEERVSTSFIRAVVDKAPDKNGGSGDNLLLDTSHVFSVTFPFNPATPPFASLKLPKELEVDFLQLV